MKVELLAITPNAEKLIEKAGRTCYQSEPKSKDGVDIAKRFISMIVRNGHHSVLEHATATFKIGGVSRACTHQLVRHRLASYSQQSQRYVDEKNFSYVTPDSISENPEAKKIYDNILESCKESYRQLKELGVKKEDARFVLPNAVATEIVMSANLREWRFIIALRGKKAAQWEIRKLAIEILKLLKQHAPTVFEDMAIDDERNIITVASEI